MKTFIILAVGLIFTVFLLIVFTPFFRESGASFNATVGIGNFHGMSEISTMWPLIMWSIPLGVLALVAFFWVRERNKR